MASGGDPMPPTGGRCGVCAWTNPAAPKLSSPMRMAMRIDKASMPAFPGRKSFADIFDLEIALRKPRLRGCRGPDSRSGHPLATNAFVTEPANQDSAEALPPAPVTDAARRLDS